MTNTEWLRNVFLSSVSVVQSTTKVHTYVLVIIHFITVLSYITCNSVQNVYQFIGNHHFASTGQKIVKMVFDWKNKVLLITGASKGIGANVTKQALAEGVQVSHYYFILII